MVDIKLLKPIIEFKSTPRCDAIRTNHYANDTPDTNKRCKKYSTIAIDGKNYCRPHAGVKALEILMRNNLVGIKK